MFSFVLPLYLSPLFFLHPPLSPSAFHFSLLLHPLLSVFISPSCTCYLGQALTWPLPTPPSLFFSFVPLSLLLFAFWQPLSHSNPIISVSFAHRDLLLETDIQTKHNLSSLHQANGSIRGVFPITEPQHQAATRVQSGDG